MALTVSAQWPDRTLQVDVQIPTTGITALYGRSGSGKTSILRLIAGLDPLPNAQIYFDQQCWQDGHRRLPTEQRRIGLVMQQPGLFTHLSVQQNLQYALKRRQTCPELPSIDWQQVIDRLELAPLLSASCQQLSGGQQQRVALGRALLCAPRLLLLDEPFASLDVQSKETLIPLLRQLHQDFAIPILLVSHDARELCALADQVMRIENGRLQQAESLALACSNPAAPLFADRQLANQLVGTWQSPQTFLWQGQTSCCLPTDSALTSAIELTVSEFNTASPRAEPLLTSPTRLAQPRLFVRACDVRLAAVPVPQLAHEPQCVVTVQQLQRYHTQWLVRLLVDGNGAELYSLQSDHAAAQLQLQIGLRYTALLQLTKSY